MRYIKHLGSSYPPNRLSRAIVETFLEPMANRGVGVLVGRCIEHYGAGEAFLPLLEVFDRCCRATGGPGLVARLQRFAPTWLAQMPGLLSAQEHQALQREIVGATAPIHQTEPDCRSSQGRSIDRLI